MDKENQQRESAQEKAQESREALLHTQESHKHANESCSIYAEGLVHTRARADRVFAAFISVRSSEPRTVDLEGLFQVYGHGQTKSLLIISIFKKQSLQILQYRSSQY